MDSRLLELWLLLETLFVGRVALALLPPGRLGSHRPEGLAATLAASLLLGFAAELVVELPVVAFGAPRLDTQTLALVAVPVALLRWITLPGAFVPSPFSSTDPATPRAVALRWIAAAAIVLGLARSSVSLWPGQGWGALLLMQHTPYLALPVMLDHALRQLDRRAGPRTWVWVVPALLVWVLPSAVVLHGALPWVAFLLGTGTALLLVWRRNADRRALAVSALAFGASACCSAAVWPLGIAGLIWLVLATPGGTRALAGRWSVAAALLLGPVAFAERSRMRAMHVDPAVLPPTLQPPGVVALLAAAALPLALIALATWWDRRTSEAPAS